MQNAPAANRTLDLASTLEIGLNGSTRNANDNINSTGTRSVLTLAFQFAYENHLRDSVGVMARQYVRSVVASVQRVAMAIAPSRLGCAQIGMKQANASPAAQTLAEWVSKSYR